MNQKTSQPKEMNQLQEPVHASSKFKREWFLAKAAPVQTTDFQANPSLTA